MNPGRQAILWAVIWFLTGVIVALVAVQVGWITR